MNVIRWALALALVVATLPFAGVNAVALEAVPAGVSVLDPESMQPNALELQAWTGYVRLSGADRYATAVAISKKYFSAGAKTVLVTTGENFPDALCASALAGAYDSPLLLVRRDTLPISVRDELVRLGATKVIILGGTGAVSEAVGAAIDSLAGVSVERLSGVSRYDTSLALIRRFRTVVGSTWSKQVFVATGTSFPDALAASAAAAHSRTPIVLTERDVLPPATLSAIQELAPTKIVVVGGTGAVSSQVEQQLKGLAATVQRISGADRYETSAKVVQYAKSTWSMPVTTLGLSSGADFPDALGAGAALGHSGQLQVMSSGAALAAQTAAYLRTLVGTTSSVTIFGGEGAVSRLTADQVREILDPGYAPPSATTPELWLSRVSSSSIALQWSAISGASGYEVVRGVSAAGPYTLVKTVTGATSFADSGLSVDTRYYYRVRAFRTVGTAKSYYGYSTASSMVTDKVPYQLYPGSILKSGQSISSLTGQYVLTMQTDGNLVQRYRSSNRVLWSTKTAGNAGAVLKVQQDGNVVIVKTDGTPAWSSGTAGTFSTYLLQGTSARLVVRHSGGEKELAPANTVLRPGETLYADEYIRSADNRYRLKMQSDGNLVHYNISTTPNIALWATYTTGGTRAVMQTDGNFVVYKSSAPLWDSHTNGHSGAYLAVQNDSNLVIYEGSTAIWSRQTSGPVFPVNLSLSPDWYGLTYPGHDVYGAYQYSAIDINLPGDADRGKSVYAVDAGVVSVASDYISIRHTGPLYLKNGTRIDTWYTMYGHLARASNITHGMTVAKGQVLGTISNVGATNNHLHFVIFRGWADTRANAISPYWLPGVYSSDPWLYADDQYGTRDNGGEVGLYENRILSAPPTQ